MHLTEIDHLTDFELSNKVKNENCSISLEELIKRHAGICDVMAKKFSFSNNYTTGVGYFDLFSEHKMIIYEAAKEFDVEKNVKFVTFVGSKMRFFCLKKINNLKKTNIFNITPPEDCDKEEFHDRLTSSNQNFFYYKDDSSNEIEFIISQINRIKNPKLKLIIELRYSGDKKKRRWGYIASKLGVTVQTCIKYNREFIARCKEKFKKLQEET